MSRARASTSSSKYASGGNQLQKAQTIAWRLLVFLIFCLIFAAASIQVILMRYPGPGDWSGLVGYPFVHSPNYNDRPFGETVNTIIVHSTAQHSLLDTVKVFQDPLSKVSAHFVVGKDGTVIQMVPLVDRAWHAGVSVFHGVKGVNDYSIGIEISNLNNGIDPYTEAQYRAVADIVRRCRVHYDIPNDRIVSHADVALPPGRKNDPLGFDFQKLYKEAAIERS